jgi:UDP-2,3-diacylglucosamine pyrophosphatase LpxH
VSNKIDHSDDEAIEFKLRTIFISDIHLGTSGCQAEVLLDFLKHCHADTYYLVGDIVDGWRLKKSWYWPQSHNDVVQKLLRKARKGSRIIYVPGNHDEFLRNYFDLSFGALR